MRKSPCRSIPAGALLVVYRSAAAQQKGHIEGKGQERPGFPDIIVSELDRMGYMIFFRVVEDRLCAFDISGAGLYLYKGAFPLITDHKIHLEAGILVEIVELAPHLGEDIGDQVFKDSAFVAIEVALQDVKLRSVLQHADEQAGVAHIDLKGILFRIPIQRQLGNGQIVAPCDDASILDPLQASSIFCGGGAFFYNGILEFLVFLGKLAGNGLETFLDAGLILFSAYFTMSSS